MQPVFADIFPLLRSFCSQNNKIVIVFSVSSRNPSVPSLRLGKTCLSTCLIGLDPHNTATLIRRCLYDECKWIGIKFKWKRKLILTMISSTAMIITVYTIDTLLNFCISPQKTYYRRIPSPYLKRRWPFRIVIDPSHSSLSFLTASSPLQNKTFTTFLNYRRLDELK